MFTVMVALDRHCYESRTLATTGILPGFHDNGERPVANRRFEMYEYRHVLIRMRLGDNVRAISCAGLMGRRRVAALRRAAEQAGWLDQAAALPEDVEMARVLSTGRTVKSSSMSLVEPFRERVTDSWRQGIQDTTIYAALVRQTL